jgi:hypothetical protein
MRMSLRLAHLLWLVTAVAACSPEVPATQVIVSIDAEPNVRARTASLQIQVRGLPAVTADAWDSDQKLDADLDQLLLPYSLALVPKNGDATREYEVLVTARTAKGQPAGLERFVSVSRTLSGYRANKRLLLEVMLTDDCIGTIACEPDQTCKAAECAPASVDPAMLPEFTASMVPEASVSKPEDAGMQMPPPIPDAGEDAAVDPACPSGQCLCAEGVTIPCGLDFGECKPGFQTCVNNLWGPCMERITATGEICNTKDDDCDGNFDEDVVCDPGELANTTQAVCLPSGICVSTVCETHYGDCDPEEEGCERLLNTLTDCGECGAICETPNARPTCKTGECLVDKCDLDFADCDDNPADCETALDSLEHCGACDTNCALDNASTLCGGELGDRVCEFDECDGTFEDCDSNLANGCERDLDSDDRNCGACGNDCLARANIEQASCVAGQCVLDCEGDFLDCDEDETNGCELDPQVAPCPRCFEASSNVVLDSYVYDPLAEIDFDCAGTHTFNSTNGTWDGLCCGRCPDVSGPISRGASADPVYLLRATSLNVAFGDTVRLIGTRPVIIAVNGNATIDGIIDASADVAGPGAGGSSALSCDSVVSGEYATGQDGTYVAPNTRGGGGGGFGTDGGLGGGVTTSSRGKDRGTPNLIPLRGGCSGGKGGLASYCFVNPIPVGAGGGAFQLSVAGTLTINGTGRLLANGGVGPDGISCDVVTSPGPPPVTTTYVVGGFGGGSGGAILLEASAFSLADELEVVAQGNGGPGGMGGSGRAGGAGSTDADTPGGNGSRSSSGTYTGGGGGGGYGRLFMRSCVEP